MTFLIKENAMMVIYLTGDFSPEIDFKDGLFCPLEFLDTPQGELHDEL
jgi:hypothetical protein